MYNMVCYQGAHERESVSVYPAVEFLSGLRKNLSPDSLCLWLVEHLGQWAVSKDKECT